MIFKTICEVMELKRQGQNQNGDWFMYRVQEQLSLTQTKNWIVFTKQILAIGGKYSLEGTLSESPSKRYFDAGGKPAYQTTFNVLRADILSAPDEFPF